MQFPAHSLESCIQAAQWFTCEAKVRELPGHLHSISPACLYRLGYIACHSPCQQCAPLDRPSIVQLPAHSLKSHIQAAKCFACEAKMMSVQVFNGCFRAILPGGDALLTSLEVLRLAAILTKHDRCARILWTSIQNFTGKPFHGMMPIHDIQHVIGQRTGPQAAFLAAAEGIFSPRFSAGDLMLCLVYTRRNHSAGGRSHGQAIPKPCLDPNLEWGPETFQLAVAHADAAVARLLLDHPFARSGNGPAGWLVPTSCLLERAIKLVCPKCTLPGDS